MNPKTQELNTKVKGLVEKLASETDAARQSELFQRFLKVVGVFHNYSWRNTVLIFTQKPDSTRVAGFVAWKELGRYVRKGEKGISILAPSVRKVKDVDSGEDKALTYFFPVYVFDVSQTDGEALPELPQDCTGEPGELVDRLFAFASSKGIQVTQKSISTDAKGWAAAKGKEIALDDSLTPADRAAVLIHEITHCLLHFGEARPKQKQRELEAESVSYVVTSHFGLNPRSDFYLASYDVTAADLLESLPVIQQTAKEIINGVSEILSTEVVEVPQVWEIANAGASLSVGGAA